MAALSSRAKKKKTVLQITGLALDTVSECRTSGFCVLLMASGHSRGHMLLCALFKVEEHERSQEMSEPPLPPLVTACSISDHVRSPQSNSCTTNSAYPNKSCEFRAPASVLLSGVWPIGRLVVEGVPAFAEYTHDTRRRPVSRSCSAGSQAVRTSGRRMSTLPPQGSAAPLRGSYFAQFSG